MDIESVDDADKALEEVKVPETNKSTVFGALRKFLADKVVGPDS